MARRRWNIETIKQVVEGENPFYQSGYTGKEKQKKLKVGEEWTDAKGITWKKTSDGKIRVNKQMDSIREMIQKKCSVCGARIDFSCNPLDHRVFPKTGKCYDCLESEETLYRLTGKWDDYEKMKVLKNKRGVMKDFREKVIEAIEYLTNDNGVMGDVTESGELITYTGKCNPQWLVDAKEDLIKADTELKKLDEEILSIEASIKK
jgi:hypothetical protein